MTKHETELLAANAALKEQLSEANKERAWVRRKLEIPEDTGFLYGDVTLAGTMHNVWSGYRGYHNYIAAEKCDDKMGKIARQSVEIDSLKEQVAQLELENESLKRDTERKTNGNRKIRDLVDGLLAQAGYAPDSSARHNLSLMNFDDAMAKGEQ